MQISDPDEVNIIEKSKCVVGIDLGTTNSLIASVVKGNVIFFQMKVEVSLYHLLLTT